MTFRHPIGIGDVADRSLTIDECAATLRYGLDRGMHVIDKIDDLAPDVALLGMNDRGEMDAALEAFASFTPLSAAQMEDIRERAVEARKDKGPCWWNPDPHA